MSETVGDMSVTVRAPGKVNLYLAAGKQQPDGYHPLATVFQAVDVYDTITAAWAEDLTLSMTGRGAGLPVDDSNLAIRAARALAEFASVPAKAQLQIYKEIPVAGGMAGGSADAAGTLVALDRLWGLGVPAADLLAIGAALGADVPFCLMGGTALGLGRGDLLTPLISRGDYTWVFVTQEHGLSTPAVFAQFDALFPDAATSPAVDERFIAALAQGDTELAARLARNDLTEATLSLHEGARATMAACARAGLPALVSGSGPTIAVYVAERESAPAVAELMQASVPGVECIHASGPVPGAHVV